MIDELLRETNGEECADESKRSDFRSDPIYSSSETGKGTGERDTERSRFRTGVKAEFSLFTMELRLEEMEFRRLEKKSLSIEASTSGRHLNDIPFAGFTLLVVVQMHGQSEGTIQLHAEVTSL